MAILIIDTSTQFLNIALLENEQIIASVSKRVKTNHSEHVMSEIDRLLTTHQLTNSDIHAIAVAQGPGSYTGLRIGISIAKMLAYALSIPIYQFSSLALIALQGQGDSIIPLIDARRQAVFAGKYGPSMTENDQYITLASLVVQLNAQQQSVCFVGDQVDDLLAPWLSQLTIPYQIVNIEHYDLTHFIHIPLVKSDAFNMKPSYLRLSEAEANLLKK